MSGIRFQTAFIFLIAASACFADEYDVNITTSSMTPGSTGAIYFEFSGGLNADPASVSITNFTIGPPGMLTSSSPNPIALPPGSDGGVKGSLDSPPLTIDNSTALNDYLHYFTFGSFLSFQVDFRLPPVLMGQSGSEFDFQLDDDSGLAPVLTNDASGNIGKILYDQNGAFTTDTLGNDSIETITLVPTPEPSSWLMLTSALGICWRIRRR
jgi:hypothetical protein